MNFGPKAAKKPSSVLAIDCGSSAFKLVQLQKKGDKFIVNGFSREKTPDENRGNVTEEVATGMIQRLLADGKAKQKAVWLTMSLPSTLVRYVETPVMTLEDVRKAISLNPMMYLRQDCSDFFLDCAGVTRMPRPGGNNAPEEPGADKTPKMNVLVAGARKNEVQLYVDAAAKSSLQTKAVALNALTTINAFEVQWGEAFRTETAAIIDIGYRSSSLNLLDHGTPVLTRLVEFGGEHITEYVMEMLSIEREAAEHEKLQMSEPVQQLVQDSLLKLVQDLRGSLDFFENQYGLSVARIGISGGTAQSPFIVKHLGDALGIPCHAWKPTEAFDLSRSGGDEKAELTADWAGAVGAALSFLY